MCPLKYSIFAFIVPGAFALFVGNVTVAAPILAIGATSIAKYWFDSCHVADLVTVFVGTTAVFAMNPVIVVPYACVAWNIVVFVMRSRRCCVWHATIHLSTGIGVTAWILNAMLVTGAV